MTKILVIEDEQSISDSIIDILEIDGFDTSAAENGRVGLQIAKEQAPDLILCDVEMPELNGHEVLTALHQDPATASIPFIFLTAKSERSDLRQGMGLGADDYLAKPFQAEELRQAIATQLQKKALRDQQSYAKLEALRNSITRSLPAELEKPLHHIQTTTAELLKKHTAIVSDGTGLEMLLSLQGSAKRLQRLVENFMLYAQIELLASDADLVAAFRASQAKTDADSVKSPARLKAKQANRGDDLQFDLDDSVVLISKSDLTKITEELVDNALKFSPAESIIQVVGKVAQNGLFILSVTDQGQGMTTQQLASIGAYMQFGQKFYEQQGTGLGLAIARRITELYGGKLTIESASNVGTTIRVILPVEK
jgi:two-component system, sensor histidine kinase and response regulator